MSGDYSLALSATGEECETRTDNTLRACTDQFLIRDSDGEWNDVIGLWDARARHLDESESLGKVRLANMTSSTT